MELATLSAADIPIALPMAQAIVIESLIGTSFEVRVTAATTVGICRRSSRR